MPGSGNQASEAVALSRDARWFHRIFALAGQGTQHS